ncbi:MAG: hypothetical protein HY427_01250 [Candidatus Levybacteria bacterium]|nr:hypothetical protein [Candidatus Levybacteria bacterium]
MVQERLRAAKGLPENQDPTRQFAINQASRLLRVARVKDPGPKDSADRISRTRSRAPEQESQEAPRRTIAEYKQGVSTPELWTTYWQDKFQADGRRIGINLEVPDCDWTEEEIKRPMVDIRGERIDGIMVPVVSSITLPVLGRMYPAMQSRTVREDSPVVDTHNTQGWIKVYGAGNAPNCNTGQAEAEKFAGEKGYLPGREITYILGSQAKKDFSNEYFDQGATWSWLPGSQIDGRLVNASFYPRGRLHALWHLNPDIPDQSYGWRFEEVKK